MILVILTIVGTLFGIAVSVILGTISQSMIAAFFITAVIGSLIGQYLANRE